MSLVLNVEILGEFKNLTAATKGAQTQLQQMNSRASKVSAGINKAFATIGVGFSLMIIRRELEEASKAAIDDLKSQTLLANQMRNTTAATDDQIKSVEKQINKLQLSASVADDELRPAYATLLRSTKSSTEAMKLLTLATDVSAGSGKGLTSVTMALSKAYQGKMAALTKLGIPMSDSIQNASDYAKEMTKLNKLQNEAIGLTGTDYTKAMEKVADQQDKVNRIAADGVDWQKDLAEAFAGSAKEAANVDAYQRLNIAFGEIQEQIGMQVLPILERFAEFMVDLTPKVMEFFAQLNDPATKTGKSWAGLTKAITTFGDTWEGVEGKVSGSDIFTFLVDGVAGVINAFNAAGTIITSQVEGWKKILSFDFAGGMQIINEGISNAGKITGGSTTIQSGLNQLNPPKKTTTSKTTNVTVQVKTINDAKTTINEVKRFTNATGTSLGRALQG